MFSALNRSHFASHGPHVAGGGLEANVHVAAAEVHEPGEAGVGRVAGRGPVVARLHARKRILFFPLTCTCRIGKRGEAIFFINHRLPLIFSRQTPHPRF